MRARFSRKAALAREVALPALSLSRYPGVYIYAVNTASTHARVPSIARALNGNGPTAKLLTVIFNYRTYIYVNAR